MKTFNDKHIHLLHFNDVYDIGKASKFVEKINSFKIAETLTIFSGDIFFPSLESTIKEGFQMVKVLEEMNVDYAIPGNHDLENDEEHFLELIKSLKINWLLSNFKKKVSGKNLGNCADFDIVDISGIKIGFFGLIDLNWIETSTITIDKYTLEDFIEKAKYMSGYLKEQGCDIVIAITHMKNQDDEHLLIADNNVDIVLGGHDHVYMIKRHNNKLLIKSGTNFENFSSILLSLSQVPFQTQSKNNNELDHEFFYFIKKNEKKFKDEYKFSLNRPYGYLNINLKPITVEINDPPSIIIDEHVRELNRSLDEKFKVPLCKLISELDVRSNACRLKENALANLITDITREKLDVDIVFLSGGHIRADTHYPSGHILTYADICSLFPWLDNFWISELTGNDIKIILEQGYRSLPNAGGNFLHISGLQITVDAKKEPMERLSMEEILVDGKAINNNKVYRVAALSFMTLGKDGFSHFKNVNVIGIENKTLNPYTVLYNYLNNANVNKNIVSSEIQKDNKYIENTKGKESSIDAEGLLNGVKNKTYKKIISDKDNHKSQQIDLLENKFVKGKVLVGSNTLYLLDLYPDGRVKIINLN